MCCTPPGVCVRGVNKVLCRLVLHHIFGVKVCPYCPECNSNGWRGPPCQDSLGSNATAVGGVFGRVDAFFGSIENQKGGALHLHGQLFAQCLHQHTPLHDVLHKIRTTKADIVKEYLAYANHVSRASYPDPAGWKSAQVRREEDWPEYKSDPILLSKPEYLSKECVQTDDAFSQAYARDIQAVQERRQHHVHIVDQHGERQPLTHCRRKEDPKKCKANFPKTGELVLTEPAVVCKGLAESWT